MLLIPILNVLSAQTILKHHLLLARSLWALIITGTTFKSLHRDLFLNVYTLFGCLFGALSF